MKEVETFVVHPTGESFSIYSPNPYYRAHLQAAKIAASGKLAFVTRDAISGGKCGFRPADLRCKETTLRAIIDQAISSYFDFTRYYWLPLPAETIAASTTAKASI